jgi:hypothetical protein
MVPAHRRQGTDLATSAKAHGSAGRELTDGGTAPRRPHARRQGEEQDVVLAADEGELDGIDAERRAELAGAGRQRQPIAVEDGADAALAAQAMEVEGDAVGDVDGGGAAAAAQPAAQLELGRWPAMGGDRAFGGGAQRTRQGRPSGVIGAAELLE